MMSKWALLFLVVLCLLFKPGWANAQGYSFKDGEIALKAAQQALASGQYQIALSKASQIIPKYRIFDSIVVEAHLIKGNVFLKQEKYGLSKKEFLNARKVLSLFPNKNTLIHAQYYNDLGHYYFAENQIDQAYRNYERSYKIRKERLGLRSPQVASSKNNMGNCFYTTRKYLDAIKAYQEAFNILIQHIDKSELELAALYNNLANSYSGLGDFEAAKIYYKQCLQIRRKILPPGHVETFHCIRNIGKLFLDLNELDSAEIYFKLAMKGYQKNTVSNRPKIADAQMDLSNIYLAKGRLDSALALNQRALAYNKAQFGADDYKTGRTLRQMGQTLIEMGRYAKALTCFQHAKSIFDHYNGIEEELANLQDDLGNSYAYLGVWEQSLNAYISSLQLRESIYGEQHPYIAGSLINLGLYFQQVTDYTTATAYFLRAEAMLKKKTVTNFNHLITLYHNIGNCYLLQKEYSKALDYYGKAGDFISTTGTSKQKADFYRNKGQVLSQLGQHKQAKELFLQSLQIMDYDPGKSPNQLLDPSGVVYSLWFMGNSLKAQYTREKSNKILEEAASFYHRAIQLIEGMGSTFVDSKDKLKLSENFKSILEDFLETKFMLYTSDKKEQHLLQAFTISEKNKNIFLNDIWQNSLHTSSHWRAVRATIAQLEKKLWQAESAVPLSDQQRRTLEHRMFQKKAELDSIQKTLIETSANQKETLYFPRLYEVMYKEQAGLISYFAGDRFVFAFYVGGGTIKGLRMERKKIDDLVYKLVSSIVSYPTQTLRGQVAADSSYIESAVHLYQELWAPLFKNVSHAPLRMFISPDGILGFLPFEALLKHRPKERQRYRNYPFLLLDYELSYVFTILPFLSEDSLNSERTFSNKLQCLKFAPSFVNHPMGLAELAHNQQEVKAISKIIRGKTVLGEKASLNSFSALAPNYPIIHLATHGKAGGRGGALSFLAFTETQDSLDEEYLYLSDLEAYSLHAEMVVLSACESGIGEFQYGEGLISIGRGFTFANAKSVISTLWSINDAKTVGLMTSFYQHLAKGSTKSKALQSAKIDFLHNCTHEEAHPFFWSAFVPYGEMQAFDMASTNESNIQLFIGIIFLGLTLWLILKQWPALKRFRLKL